MPPTMKKTAGRQHNTKSEVDEKPSCEDDIVLPTDEEIARDVYDIVEVKNEIAKSETCAGRTVKGDRCCHIINRAERKEAGEIRMQMAAAIAPLAMINGDAASRKKQVARLKDLLKENGILCLCKQAHRSSQSQLDKYVQKYWPAILRYILEFRTDETVNEKDVDELESLVIGPQRCSEDCSESSVDKVNEIKVLQVENAGLRGVLMAICKDVVADLSYEQRVIVRDIMRDSGLFENQ